MRLDELRTYLRRTAEGGYRLESDDGSVIVEGRTYRQIRGDLEVLLGAMQIAPGRLKILIGAPRRPPRSVPPPASTMSAQFAAVTSFTGP
jgi:hypothetical protein